MTKASYYRCPNCLNVFIREGQRHSVISSCDMTGVAHIVCPRVFKWRCQCGNVEYTGTRAIIPCWCDECRMAKEFKPEIATL
jgi:hypothetical protein